ncbi:NADPH-dependent FMN reductase [Sphingobium boeckii]|uniref:FMN reductase n=1 Tax=Sphingobium boeckii TaxID=1082345 RepID=A0A7W9EEN1_9SPHN|nr:NAD(P)H-dependent oxidoreductase [Sphingobium boeckii]MBB5686433.1 FMN reductase [Sphingobium boeckii]
MQEKPLIVGLGGTGSPNSSSERLLRHALGQCAAKGADTLMFAGLDLDLPMYSPGEEARDEKTLALIAGLRRAQGVIIASPGYHGTVSGLIKNALDYVQDMAKDDAVYFEGRAVGLIATAAGWQATGTTLATLRSITHALRGWPTPMALAVNSMVPVFGEDGSIVDTSIANQLDILASQVVTFANMRALHDLSLLQGVGEREAGGAGGQ